MNYLGHFYVASITNSSYCGALLGDFIKGHQWQTLPHSLQLGILLHRRLDSWIDQWVIHHQITAQFPHQIRRFAPIALDLYWDYQIACNWTDWHLTPLTHVIQEIYDHLSHPTLPISAQKVVESMLENDWLSQYNQLHFIPNALKSIENRMSSSIPINMLINTLKNQEQLLQDKSIHLMQDIQQLAPQWRQEIASKMID